MGRLDGRLKTLERHAGGAEAEPDYQEALAAWRVLLAAVVRVRRPVVFDGDLAAVVRAVPRDVLLRAVALRAGLLRAVERDEELLLVVVLVVLLDVVVAMSGDQPLRVSVGSLLVLSLRSQSVPTLRTLVCKPGPAPGYRSTNGCSVTDL